MIATRGESIIYTWITEETANQRSMGDFQDERVDAFGRIITGDRDDRDESRDFLRRERSDSFNNDQGRRQSFGDDNFSPPFQEVETEGIVVVTKVEVVVVFIMEEVTLIIVESADHLDIIWVTDLKDLKEGAHLILTDFLRRTAMVHPAFSSDATFPASERRQATCKPATHDNLRACQ